MKQTRAQQKAYLLAMLSEQENKKFVAKCDNLASNWFRPFTKEENDRYENNKVIIRDCAAGIRNLKDLLVFLDMVTTTEESI